jgi:hypothetical protein
MYSSKQHQPQAQAATRTSLPQGGATRKLPLHHAVGNQALRQMLQAHPEGGADGSNSTAQKSPALMATEALRGPGAPLPSRVQSEASLRYGHSFSNVRVHTHASASAAARSLHASAFTLGQNIAFRADRYAPDTVHGQLLLQHELHHVAQQRSATPVLLPEIESQHSQHELEAREIFGPQLHGVPVQRIQCAPEEQQFSLGGGLVDKVGQGAFGERAWPFIKAVLEGFVGGVQADVKSGRASAAKSHLSKLLVPWNAAKFYGGYLVGLVLGLISPITDLVKGAIGLVKLGISALEWLAKWSPVGVAISQERQRKIAQLIQKFSDLATEFGNAIMDFAKDPKGTIRKFSGFLDNLMQMALGKAREIGAKAAHSIFDFLQLEYYEMGKGIGEVIGALVAQVLLLVFSDAIGNLISKGASFLGKAAEFVAGKAVAVFEWVKGLVSEVVTLLRNAVKGALKLFEGLLNKTVEAFDALKALFTEAAAALEFGGETAAAGVGRGGPKPLGNVLESRALTPARTSPATVADLTPPKVHPSNVPKQAPKPAPGKAPFDEPLTAAEKKLTPEQLRQKQILESFEERQSAAYDVAEKERAGDPSRTRTRKQAGVSLEEDHHIATRYLEKNRKIFEAAGTHVDADLNLIKEFPEHGQLRGWYDWKNRSYKYSMKGHHPEYNRWVTKTLTDATPAGLAPDQALNRILQVNQKLENIIRQYPEVLSHGPDILPPHLRNLTF